LPQALLFRRRRRVMRRRIPPAKGQGQVPLAKISGGAEGEKLLFQPGVAAILQIDEFDNRVEHGAAGERDVAMKRRDITEFPDRAFLVPFLIARRNMI
jgi:hypothetical protein